MGVDKSDNWKTFNKVLDYVRYVFSTIISLASLGLIVYAIGKGYAALPGHPAIHYALFVFVIILLAYLEGLQIAILALERTDPKSFSNKKRAFVSHTLAIANNGHNVQRFLVGRQFFVVFVVFLCAQLTTYTKFKMDFIPKWLFIIIIETGLPGALIVLGFGQLMPQLIATTNPITFMNIPFTWSVIQLCLLFESVGVTHFVWILAGALRIIFKIGPKENITGKKESIEMDIRNQSTDQTKSPNVKSLQVNVHVGSKKHEPVHKGGHVVNLDDGILTSYNSLVDIDALYAGAENGLTEASSEVINSQQVMRWLRDDSINPSSKTGEKKQLHALPMPPTIVRHLVQNGQPVPRYLLPPYHPEHIAPHIVAFELLRREEILKKCKEDHVCQVSRKRAISGEDQAISGEGFIGA